MMSDSANSGDAAGELWRLNGEHVAIVKNPRLLGAESHESLLCILTHVRENLGARQELADCFVEMIRGLRDVHSNASYGWRSIPFCMRELQWPKINAVLKHEILQSRDPEHLQYLGRILAAYSEDWPDGSMFT